MTGLMEKWWRIIAKEKSRWKAGLLYGWVSKYREIKFPYTILKIISSNKKLFVKNFIHIFLLRVNKQLQFHFESTSTRSILRNSAILVTWCEFSNTLLKHCARLHFRGIRKESIEEFSSFGSEYWVEATVWSRTKGIIWTTCEIFRTRTDKASFKGWKWRPNNWSRLIFVKILFYAFPFPCCN